MESFFYLAGLLIAIGGLMMLDRRYKLAFWLHPRRAAITLLNTVLIFVIWDILAIWLGIFRVGHSAWQLPLTLASQFPFEELFFLFLIGYSTLIIYTGVAKWRSRI